MGDNRLREEILKAKCTYKYILTGINKEVPDDAHLNRDYLLPLDPNISIEHLLTTTQLQKDGTSHYIFSSRFRPDCFHLGHQILGRMASDWQQRKTQRIKLKLLLFYQQLFIKTLLSELLPRPLESHNTQQQIHLQYWQKTYQK